MDHLVIIRRYRPEDQEECRSIIKECINSNFYSAFYSNLLKETTFQILVLLAAVMFIFLGLPCTTCAFVLPLVIVLIWTGTHVAFAIKTMKVDIELKNLTSTYMANAFSCFWVAEAHEVVPLNFVPKDVNYMIISERKFNESFLSVRGMNKKIVGTIGLLKSHRIERGAWIKRLNVHKTYRKKGIASALLDTALQFARDQGYSCVDVVASEHTESGKVLCLKKGFELKQMYHKSIWGMFNVLMYELTYLLKHDNDGYFVQPNLKKYNI